MIKAFLTRIYLYLATKWLFYTGVRFYETESMPTKAESIRTKFSGSQFTIDDVEVIFEFYREIYEDQFYRKGLFTAEEYQVFIVKASFRGRLVERILKFNDTRLLCKHPLFPVLPDEVVVSVLQGLYIAYVRECLKQP